MMVARGTLRDDLYAQQRTLTAKILAAERSAGAIERLEIWLERNALAVQHLERIISDMRTAGNHDFATLSVALGELRKLAQQG